MKPPDDVTVEFKNELFTGFVDLDGDSLDSRVCDESKFDVKEELDDLTKTVKLTKFRVIGIFVLLY